MSEKYTKILIIGSGPAGYTAAIYAARANLSPVLVTGMEQGGQLTITTDVENFPGFAEAVQGPWLMDQMAAQAKHVGTELISDMITEIDFANRPYTAKGQSGTTYHAECVIICTGAKARWLGIEGESTYRGFGISACATCDGFFYRGKPVAVVGGGNSAVEEALFLAQFASEVTLIHRRDTLRAEKIGQDRLFAHPKIKVLWNKTIDGILGNPPGAGQSPVGVTGLKLKDTVSGDLSELAVDGVFVAIGHDPATEIFKGKVEMDAEGYIVTAPDSTATSIPGVFAAGDVKDKIYRQAVTAAGMGCMAALEADRFLTHHAGEQ